MSQAATSPMPPARALPFTRQTTGLALSQISCRICGNSSGAATRAGPALLQVGAGAERRVGPGEHDHPAARVIQRARQCCAQLGQQGAGQRVPAGRRVQRDGRDLAGRFLADQIVHCAASILASVAVGPSPPTRPSGRAVSAPEAVSRPPRPAGHRGQHVSGLHLVARGRPGPRRPARRRVPRSGAPSSSPRGPAPAGPALTRWPAAASIRTTLPGIGAISDPGSRAATGSGRRGTGRQRRRCRERSPPRQRRRPGRRQTGSARPRRRARRDQARPSRRRHRHARATPGCRRAATGRRPRSGRAGRRRTRAAAGRPRCASRRAGPPRPGPRPGSPPRPRAAAAAADSRQVSSDGDQPGQVVAVQQRRVRLAGQERRVRAAR